MQEKLMFYIILSLSLFTFNVKATEITCYSSVYAPYSFLENDKPTGIDIDLITKIAEKLKLPVSFKIIPWSRLKQLMLVSEIECAAAFLRSPDNEKVMAYMKTPITTGDYSLFIAENNKNALLNISDFYGATIAVNRGFSIPTELKSPISKGLIKIYEVNSPVQSLQMLSTSRVKAALIDKHVGNYYKQKLNIEKITTVEPPLVSTPVYLVFSKELEENGIYKELV